MKLYWLIQRGELVKYPTAQAGGFYAVPPTERTRGGLRGPLPGPLFVAISGEAGGLCSVNDWHN